MVRSTVVLASLILGFLTSVANASVLINVTQDNSDVLFSTSGSLDVTGLDYVGGNFRNNQIIPQAGALLIGTPGLSTLYTGLTSTISSFGPGGSEAANEVGGSILGFYGQNLWVPYTYQSGNPINGFSRFTNSSFASLGLTPGRYEVSLPSDDQIVLQIGTVPLPGSAPLLGTGLLALAGIGYAAKRKKAAAA